jgi:hypothetical protein
MVEAALIGEQDGAGAPRDPVLPDYGGACLSSLAPALMDRRRSLPPWLPEMVSQAEQVALLVLDGLGWELLGAKADRAPTLVGAAGGPITSVVPTTTATALTSISTGSVPAAHGIVGYRLRLGGAGADAGTTPARGGPEAPAPGEVVNILRWRSERGDLRRRVPAARFQLVPAFQGSGVPAVTRADFASTGFTAAHLGGTRIVGWHVPSSLVVDVGRLLGEGEPFVYAYYDGLDKVAHQHGLGDFYDAELHTVDRLVGDLLGVLPPGAALVVTSDHGQVEVGDAVRLPGPELMAGVSLVSGEGRFRWFHARAGAADDVATAAREAHGDEAWVVTRDEMIEAGWFGGPLRPDVAGRLGDVALVARASVAFLDPADTGETRLMARHGSLTPAEMYVPLLVWGPRDG